MYRLIVVILLIYALYLSRQLTRHENFSDFAGDCTVPLKYDTVDKAAQRFTNFTLQLKDGILDGSLILGNGLKHTGKYMIAHDYVYLTKNPNGQDSQINTLLAGSKSSPHSICLNGHHLDRTNPNGSRLWSSGTGDKQIGL